jgi:hypothetical protein
LVEHGVIVVRRDDALISTGNTSVSSAMTAALRR